MISLKSSFPFRSLLTFRKGQTRYRDPITHQMTPALYRVRKPYFWKNMAGLVICSAIPLTVYIYTWKVLSKDEFSDIPIPPIEDSELKQLQNEYNSKKN